ncbi:unnamed protein product, partial [Durusdinium trenchii]
RLDRLRLKETLHVLCHASSPSGRRAIACMEMQIMRLRWTRRHRSSGAGAVMSLLEQMGRTRLSKEQLCHLPYQRVAPGALSLTELLEQASLVSSPKDGANGANGLPIDPPAASERRESGGALGGTLAQLAKRRTARRRSLALLEEVAGTGREGLRDVLNVNLLDLEPVIWDLEESRAEETLLLLETLHAGATWA